MKTLVKELFVRYSYEKSYPKVTLKKEDWTIIPVPEDWTALHTVVHFETEMESKVGKVDILKVNLV